MSYCSFRNRSTSRADGMEGCAPIRVTEMAATAEAYRAACTGAAPERRLTAKPALKASPAAVVSTAFTTKGGIISRIPEAVARKAPCEPILITTFLGPRSKSRSAQRAAGAGVTGSPALRPQRMRVSLSFGVIHVAHCSNPFGSSRAGAGSSISGISFLCAKTARVSIVIIGISSWVKSIPALRKRAEDCAISLGSSFPFAPGTTTILFCPSSPILISATPEEPFTVSTALTSAPALRSALFSEGPNESSPTLPTMLTGYPSLPAATAWLAPLPPWKVEKLRPVRVSPGRGTRSAVATRSRFMLPTTTMGLRIFLFPLQPRQGYHHDNARYQPSPIHGCWRLLSVSQGNRGRTVQ